jgi:hypothetical protein
LEAVEVLAEVEWGVVPVFQGTPNQEEKGIAVPTQLVERFIDFSASRVQKVSV